MAVGGSKCQETLPPVVASQHFHHFDSKEAHGFTRPAGLEGLTFSFCVSVAQKQAKAAAVAQRLTQLGFDTSAGGKNQKKNVKAAHFLLDAACELLKQLQEKNRAISVQLLVPLR